MFNDAIHSVFIYIHAQPIDRWHAASICHLFDFLHSLAQQGLDALGDVLPPEHQAVVPVDGPLRPELGHHELCVCLEGEGSVMRLGLSRRRVGMMLLGGREGGHISLLSLSSSPPPPTLLHRSTK